MPKSVIWTSVSKGTAATSPAGRAPAGVTVTTEPTGGPDDGVGVARGLDAMAAGGTPCAAGRSACGAGSVLPREESDPGKPNPCAVRGDPRGEA
jgi:hypothetical protein